ncbi:hypothetical protein [Rubrivirga sp. IMCC43871]|uniref:hypothetical protein n=1 Tax=Rubrivirga sp. IMCC43871 TaxID=3391575 RepID=UPI0039901FF3
MRLLLSPLALGLSAVLFWPSAPSDPCDVAGTYALDRAPIVADVVASMEASLAELGPRPDEGSLAEVSWLARKEAYQGVRAEARAGGIVPHLRLALGDDGRATYRDEDAEALAGVEHAGRWRTDAACRVVTIDMGDDEPATARIEGDRLVFDTGGDTGRQHTGPFRGVAFDRVR